MSINYLDENGLTTLWAKIKGLVNSKSDVFIVNVSYSDSVLTKDKTGTEIISAYNAGKIIILKNSYDDSEYYLSFIDPLHNSNPFAIFVRAVDREGIYAIYENNNTESIKYFSTVFNLHSYSGSTVTDYNHTWYDLWQAYTLFDEIYIRDPMSLAHFPASCAIDWESCVGGNISFVDNNGVIHKLYGFSSTNDGSDNITMSVTRVDPVDTLSELSDTTITTPTDGQLLAYDSTASKWVNIDNLDISRLNGGMFVNNDGDNNGFIVEYNERQLIQASPSSNGTLYLHYVATPTSNTDAANKAYVDSAISGITAPTVTLNGSTTTTPSFYAPTNAGTFNWTLRANGTSAPFWSPETEEIMIVTLTFDDGSVTADKSYGNIWGAIGNGKTVYAVTDPYGLVYHLYDYDFNEGQYVTFESIGWNNLFEEYYIYFITINGNDTITSDYRPIYIPNASTVAPLANGSTAAVGSSTAYARADHVHPKITYSLSMSTTGVLTLTGSDSSASTVSLPIYNGTAQEVTS